MIEADDVVRLVLIGIGATAMMDVWVMILKHLGIATLNLAMVGRWVGHFCRGRVAHPHIGQAVPIPGEVLLGWLIHYVVGIVFSACLTSVYGVAWLHDPAWLPALTVGMVTVVIPFFVMQPAMGAGIAASRTPTPWKSRLFSLLTHAVFGIGLYLCAALLALVWT